MKKLLLCLLVMSASPLFALKVYWPFGDEYKGTTPVTEINNQAVEYHTGWRWGRNAAHWHDLSTATFRSSTKYRERRNAATRRRQKVNAHLNKAKKK